MRNKAELDELPISDLCDDPAGHGVPPQSAARAIDAAFLYVSTYSLEVSLRYDPDSGVDQRVLDRDVLADRHRMLPSDTFPSTVAHIREPTSGVTTSRPHESSYAG
ncbi:hypothetical protein ABZ543_24825 [Streptomyces roseifaciens]